MASLLRLALRHLGVAPAGKSDVDGDLDCGRKCGDAIDAAPRETDGTVVTRVDGVENEGPLPRRRSARYQTQGVKEVPSSLAHWRKKIGVETTCVEIKFQAPIPFWLISTQVPT